MTPERFARIRAALSRRQPDLTVLMEGVHKAHNFSAILRNCDAAGVLGVHVVPPEGGLELHHGTSAGTKKWIEVHRHTDVHAAVRAVKDTGAEILAAHPSESSVDFREIDYTRPTAVMMGSELRGVTDDGLALADRHIVIPMLGMVHSLNVSVATALILFEAARQRTERGMYDTPRLEGEAFERRLFEWAYPTLARSRREAGRPYPRLTDDGEIIRDW